MVAREKKASAKGPMPLANMWWAQTPKPRNAIKAPEKTIAVYPNKGFREKTGSTSDTMPNAGKTRMYTSGWPKIQKRCCHITGSPPPSGR